MKVLTLFILLLPFLALSSCGQTSKTTSGNKNPVRICVEMDLLEKEIDSIQMDYLTIDSLYIVNGCLDVYVTYGGGCGEVRFNMYYTNMIQESFPPQTTIYLEFVDNDHCRALVNKKVTFNLDPFLEYAKTGGIWLNIANEKGKKVLYKTQ